MNGVEHRQALTHLSEARKSHRKEQPIQYELTNMFRSLGTGPIVAQRVGSREADIHVTDRNTVVEVKATSKADPSAPGSGRNETQEQQLEWYVRELRKELSFRNDVEGIGRKSWVGILSDGQSGWVWEWGKNRDSGARTMEALRWEPGEGNADVLEKIITALGKPKGKQWAPADRIYEIFEETETELRDLYEKRKDDPHTETKFTLWLERVKASGMAPNTDQKQHSLFVKHTFLVSVSRAVVEALAKRVRPRQAKDVLGDGFISWVTEETGGQEIVERLLKKAHQFDWRQTEADVLRKLYEQCISPEDRKMYGEYYTPDWLAEQLTERMLDEEWIEDATQKAIESIQGGSDTLNGVGVLDPTCGSGTFLFHAALRIGRALLNGAGTKEMRGKIAARLIHGIDIHPVAVEMSKATLLRAISMFGVVSEHDVDVVQGDSLLVDRGYDLLEHDIRIVSPGGEEFDISDAALTHNDFVGAVSMIVEAAKNETPMPDTIDSDLARMLKGAHTSLTKIIKSEGDSVWAHHIINLLGPSRLAKRKVNRILANPPWVRASDIQVPHRKREIENLAKSVVKIWPGGASATGFDIAALFIKRCRSLYIGNLEGRACWLANNGAIRGANWAKFRESHENLHTIEIYDYGNLRPHPFSGASNCAIIELGNKGPEKKLIEWHNTEETKIDNREPWRSIRKKIYAKQAELPKENPSGYRSKFHQGPTLVPHCLIVIDQYKLGGGGAICPGPKVNAAPMEGSQAH